MFDDPKVQNPNEPEDILAPMDGRIQPGEIKSALAHQKLKPVSVSAEPPEPPPFKEEAEISPPLLSKKKIVLGAAVLVILAIAFGAVWVLWRPAKKAPVVAPPPGEQSLPAPAPVVEPAPVPEPEPEPEPEPAPPAPVDTDNDGLTDEEEVFYGTDPQIADTDSDELTDYEEIMIWKTNPLNPDTDGDGFQDGLEVKNNYNPNGPGKLLEIPK